MHFAMVKLAGVVAATGVITSSNAVAQTADFKCPKPGTVITFADGTVSSLQAIGANYCRVHVRQPNGHESIDHWFAPTLSVRNNSADAYASQLKPSRLWPLSVGKTLAGQFSGVRADSGYQGTWETKVSVDRIERISTKAGTFDSFVITRTEQALSHPYRSTFTNWYAPDVGTVVKFTFTDSQGTNRVSEAVSIR